VYNDLIFHNKMQRLLVGRTFLAYNLMSISNKTSYNTVKDKNQKQLI